MRPFSGTGMCDKEMRLPSNFCLKWLRWQKTRFVQWANQETRPSLFSEADVVSLSGGFLPRAKMLCPGSFPLAWTVRGPTYLSGNRLCPCLLELVINFGFSENEKPRFGPSTPNVTFIMHAILKNHQLFPPRC